MKTSVSIVIPNWNGAEHIVECLESLVSQTTECHIIVVDNGSTDKSVALIQEGFPQIEVCKLSENHGFTGGVNAGIKSALTQKFEYIILFNNDAVADKNFVKELVTSAQKHPDAGVVTGKLLRTDGKHFDSTGEFYTTRGMSFSRGRNQKDTGQYEIEEQVFAGSGGASLYRSKLFKTVGLFDESFFAYFEDIDMSFRARLAGWEVWYIPKAKAMHKVGATSSKLGNFARYHSIKNFMLLYTKDMPAILYWKYLPQFWLQLIRMKLGCIRDHQLGTFVRSFFAGLSLLPKALVHRYTIQHTRKLTTKQVDALLYKGWPKTEEIQK